MTDKIILGVHSNVSADGSGLDGYVDGHAWLTITINGKTQAYGLWPDEHPRVTDNGDKSDIRIGMEIGAKADASRYYELTSEEYAKFEEKLQENAKWTYTNTCASWASETASEITGEIIDANDYGGFETPREMGKSIRELEDKQKSSLSHPIKIENRQLSSFLGIETPSLSPVAQTIKEQCHSHVHGFCERNNQKWTPGMDNTVAALAVVAREAQMSGVDALGVSQGTIYIAQTDRKGIYREAEINSLEAANIPIQQSEQRLAIADQQILAQEQQAINNPTQTQHKVQGGPRMG